MKLGASAVQYKVKLDQAITCYQKALQIDPNYAGAHNSLGAPLFAQGKLDQAITFFQKVLQIDLNYTKLPKIELFGIKLPIGLAFEQIIPSKTTSFYADVHTNLGLALSAQGKPDQAIASYRKALQIDPNHANAHNNLGNALSAQGKLEDAIASYRKALQIDPNFAGAHCALGFALSNQGKLDEAIAELEIAVHLEPTNALFRKNLEIIRNNKKGFWGRLFGG
ncbi:MAG: tetratricopeptide repeat protein [Scytonema sp. RU_4_4]|nr:tetratricopeptide repeat protein [Scytonema sp. RU_4_4]